MSVELSATAEDALLAGTSTFSSNEALFHQRKLLCNHSRTALELSVIEALANIAQPMLLNV